MHAAIRDALAQHLWEETIANVDANLVFWRAQPAECVHLVADIDEQVVGVVLVKNFWNLCSLFVSRRHRANGIGNALLLAALEACATRSPRGAVCLNAAAHAVGFYERFGFRPRPTSQKLPPGFESMQFTFAPSEG